MRLESTRPTPGKRDWEHELDRAIAEQYLRDNRVNPNVVVVRAEDRRQKRKDR